MKSLPKQIKETEAQITLLREKLDKLANDPFYAGRPELWEADRNQYFDLLDRVQALYEEKIRLSEDMKDDPAYDGSSPSLTPEEELAFFQSHAIRSREDVLASVEKIKEHYARNAKKDKYPVARLIPLLDRFAGEISACRLMELTQPWWQYEITVRETEITLSLVPTEVLYDRGRSWGEKNRPFLLPVQEAFPILTAKAALLSPEDFGKLYGVSGGTVRQWIRRGKIRSASKFGREWRIPELTIVPNWEHYIDGNYLWHQELPDVPEEFSCLNAYRQIALSSVKGKKDLWHVNLSDGVKEDAETASFDLDGKAKERLELYLLAQPLVECINNYLGDFFDKTLQEWAEEEDE